MQEIGLRASILNVIYQASSELFLEIISFSEPDTQFTYCNAFVTLSSRDGAVCE